MYFFSVFGLIVSIRWTSEEEPERGDREDLGLAAGEQAGAVGPRQDADVHRDLAQLGQAATVQPDALVEGQLAGDLLDAAG